MVGSDWDVGSADCLGAARESSEQPSGASEHLGHPWPFRSNLSYGLGKQCASSFPWARMTRQAERAAQCRRAESRVILLPGPEGFASTNPDPQPDPMGTDPEPPEEASGSAELASSSAGSSAEPEKPQPVQASERIQLPAYEASLVAQAALPVLLCHKLRAAKLAAPGRSTLELTGEEQALYWDCLRGKQQIEQAVIDGANQAVRRANQLASRKMYQGARCTLLSPLGNDFPHSCDTLQCCLASSALLSCGLRRQLNSLLSVRATCILPTKGT